MSTKKQEPEKIKYLRHRWARLVDITAAYNTFRSGEVLIGPDKVCFNEVVVAQIAQTLMLHFYSFLYSLFDSTGNAVNFVEITEEFYNDFDEDTKRVRNKIISIWEEIKEPLRKLRNKVGFHQENNSRGVRYGYRQLGYFDPGLPFLLTYYLRVFFRRLEYIYQREESYLITFTYEQVKELENFAIEYEAFLRKKSEEEIKEEFYNTIERALH